MARYNRIIFVAKSGTSRAPMAAAILREMTLKRPVEILSRGMVVLFPEPLNQKAEAVMASNGLPTEGFMSSPLTEEDLTEDTLILTMEQGQREKLIEKFGQANENNIQVLTEYVGDELEIMDPYGGSLQAYGLCCESLTQSIRKLANMLNEGE